MSLDGAFLHVVKTELIRQNIIGARVDKIYQPSRDEIVITFRSFGELKSPKLLISANPASARVCLTSATFENPASPPLFCTVLRKRLSSGRLTAITQDGLERVLNFDFTCSNEIGDTVQNRLIVEIMGRTSNIILINSENNKIIDCIKKVTDDVSSERRVLPNLEYISPPRDETRFCLLSCEIGDIPLDFNDKILLRTLEGVSPIFVREALFYANSDEKKLAEFLEKAKFSLINNTPDITLISEKGEFGNKPKDFCFTDITQYGDEMIVTKEKSANALLDKFFGEKANAARLKQRSGSLTKSLKTAYERVQKKLAAQKQELIECSNRDKFRVCGDLINGNIYRLEKGALFLEAENYETGETEKIKLDPKFTPAQNAQKYYALYRKLANAEKALSKLIEEGERELNYLDSVIDAANRAVTDAEMEEIRLEIEANKKGISKANNNKKASPNSKASKALPPMKFVASDGTEILIGRNNRQNDELTFKIASPDDMWLHTKDIAGSHVILRLSKNAEKGLNESALIEAAALAAYCSKGRESGRVPVDYTLVKYVKKPSGAKPGYVIFTNNRTAYVKPDKDIYEGLINGGNNNN